MVWRPLFWRGLGMKQGTEIRPHPLLGPFLCVHESFVLSVTESWPHAWTAPCGRDISPVTLSLVKVLSSLHEGEEGYLSRILCSGGYTGVKTGPWGFKGPGRSRVSRYTWKQAKRDESVVFDLWSAYSLTPSLRKVSACLPPFLVCLWGSRLPSSTEGAQRLIQDQLWLPRVHKQSHPPHQPAAALLLVQSKHTLTTGWFVFHSLPISTFLLDSTHGSVPEVRKWGDQPGRGMKGEGWGAIGQPGWANTRGQGLCSASPAGDIGAPGAGRRRRSLLCAPRHRPGRMRPAVRALLACAVLGECGRWEGSRRRRPRRPLHLGALSTFPGLRAGAGSLGPFLRFSSPHPHTCFSTASGTALRLCASSGLTGASATFSFSFLSPRIQ